MTTLLVASSRPGVGKTAFAAAFAAHLLDSGRKVALAKAPDDAQNTSAESDLFKTLVPRAVTPAEPMARGDFNAVAQTLTGLARDADVTIVEGWDDDAANRRLADALDARVLWLAELRDFQDDIVGALRPFGDRLAGVIVNNLPQYREYFFQTEALPKLEEAGIPCLGAIPEDRRMLATTFKTVYEHLGGNLVQKEGDQERLADHILIGANVLDWGVHYFSTRENAVVLIRGDRPDIQMAALATPIKGMILTRGIEPLEYVFYEARRLGIPISVIAADTHDAAAALESLQEQKARFDHPDKVVRFKELARQRLDLETLEQALREPVTR